MALLEQFGIIEPVTSSPALHAEICELGHEEYVERTSKLLAKLGDIGDTVHDHSWHVSSLVLKGIYRDDIIDLEPALVNSEEERQEQELLHVFEARYSEEDKSIVLVTDGECARITSKHERRISEGDTHAIEPRIFHQPTIPITTGAATLVLNSFRAVEHGPYVLMDVPNEQQPSRSREPATLEDIDQIKRLLLS